MKKSLTKIESRLKNVENDFLEFDKVQTRLEFLDSNEKANRLDSESSLYTEIAKSKKIIAKFQQLNDLTIKQSQFQTTFSPNLQNKSVVANLPDLNLPEFYGKYETWFSFRDQFEALVENRQDISEVSKLMYLKACCQDDVLKLIENLHLTADNYTIAFELLRKRYENRRAIINTHIYQLLFELPHITRESSSMLRKLLDLLYQHLSALEKLQLPVEKWDALLIPIILQKLDDRTKKEWENKQNDQRLPTMSEFTDFLTKKCFTLEAVHSIDSLKNNNSNELTSSRNKPSPLKTQNTNFRRIVGHVQSPINTSNQNTCLTCNKNHLIYQCPEFINLNIKENYQELYKHKLCTNCLRPGHFKQDCLSGGCKKCDLKHNTALHVDNYRPFQQNSQNPTQRSQYGNATSQPSSSRQVYARTTESIESLRVNRQTSAFCAPVQNETSQQLRHTTSTRNQNLSSEINQSDENYAQNGDFHGENAQATHTYTIIDSNQVLLSTATVLIQNNINQWIKCTALLDSGSQSNLISEKLVEQLRLKCKRIDIPLAGINQIETKINYRTNAKIKSKNGDVELNLQFSVLSQITQITNLPLIKFEKTQLKLPKGLELADEQFNVPKRIDLLLGAGIFFDLLKEGKLKFGENKPVLQETSLGWIISGNLNLNEDSNKMRVCNVNTKISNKQLNDALTKFWQIEELDAKILLSKSEQYCEEYFKTTTKRDEHGKFIVKYPFNPECTDLLGNTKIMALKRFKNLEVRLGKNDGLKSQYINFMRDYENLGHMTYKGLLESDTSIEGQTFFSPHTAVLRDSSVTTKCRVVLDASAKSSTNISLNDLILTGPHIQEDLYSILLRLRLRTYVLSVDIKMMYRCIDIDPSERCFQKIVWRENSNEPIKVYELNTATYGTSSAPFQATRCLKELALQNKLEYSRTSQIIEKCFYMDDLLISVDSKQEVIEIYHEISEILTGANFELRKWSSNNKSVLDYIKNSTNSQDENFVLFHDEKQLKTLGIIWDANEDVLRYSLNLDVNEKNVTKRTILSLIAQIFDPLGLISPAIIKAKLIIQQLWHLKLDWDENVPEDLKNIWLKFITQISYLNDIKFNRHVLLPNTKIIEIYDFCDSSEKAYGACVYLSSTVNGEKRITLFTAKSRVAPLKKQTLPRLELLGALLLAELIFKIKNTVDIHIDKITYFTDSTIVLAWLNIEPCKLKRFVANRVTKITEISKVNNWKHVNTKNNAADVVSRGLSPKELLDHKSWINGPDFLKSNFNYEYDPVSKFNDMQDLPELKNQPITLVIQERSPELDIFQKYSTFLKLLNVTAYILRFKNHCLNKEKLNDNIRSQVLTTQELSEAQNKLIKLAQNERFEQEISDLKNSKNVNKQSKLLNLRPFLDSQNILRVGGRLSKSSISFDQQHPIILPYKHKLTELIILDFRHLKHLHAGTQNLLSIIRLNFWPLNGKNAVKRIVKSCIRCYRTHPKPCKFIMGDLPSARINPSRPFSNCGIDYAGPILVKEGTSRRSNLVKTYICIFICFATRAIHIELVKDLTTHSFLNALKRFCSRRGKPSDIYSDNGLNFVGANNYFSELYDILNDKNHNDSVSKFLARDRINWHFNPARSAHMGGLWEAAVKSTKFHLKRVLGESHLTYEEMYTLLVEIESCLNSRPLSPLSNDPTDFVPLTPAHFLIGDSLASLPEKELKEAKISRADRYYRLQQLKQQFWDRWSKDYLSQLQTRSKWKLDVVSLLKVGSMVVLIEDNLPSLRWPLARVVKLHYGTDNVVRVVSVRMANGNILKRTISKVCALPIEY